MNFQQQEQFYQVMSRLRGNSRVASTQDTRVTELLNGLLVSKPVMKQPEIAVLNDSWIREQKGKAVPVNKLREIMRFQMSDGRY